MYAIRPSAAWIWGTGGCRGYAQMVALYPDIPGITNDTVREEGIAGHWVVHKMGQGFIVPEGTLSPNGVEVDDDMLDGAAVYLDDLRTRSGGHPVYMETTLAARWIHEQCGGTPDAWSWNPVTRTLTVWDYKYGFRYVDAFENPQPVIYVSAVLDHLHQTGVIVLDGYSEQDITVDIVIVQPRSYGQGVVRNWKVKAAMLRPLWNVLRAAAIEVVGPNPTLRAGDHCNDCSARMACPAAQRAGLVALDIAARAVPNELTPTQAGEMLRRLIAGQQALKSMITGLEQQLLFAMGNGHQDPHWTMGYGNTKTVYVEGGEQQLMALAKVMGKDVAKPARAITPLQAMKIMDPALVARFTTQQPGRRKLVPFTERSLKKALSQ
jgi:hypothetical protein